MGRFNYLNVPDQWRNYWTKYPNGYTILESLMDWISQVDSMVDNQNKLNKTVEDYRLELDVFKERFGPNLEAEVTNILSEWQISGFLDVVISEALQSEIDTVKTQLAEIVTLITPSMAQEEIQNLLSQDGHYKFADGTYIVDLLYQDYDSYPCSFICYSNTTIEFAENAKIELGVHNNDNYKIFACSDVENVEFINPKINGRKDLNGATTGEFGMGISLKGTNNIRILNPTIINCWGDGIYIGSTVNQPYCKNTFIQNVHLDGNRRQGISIISVIDCFINGGVIKNTNGTAPSDGIDIEPNKTFEFLQNLVIDNLRTENNAGSGIKFFAGFYIGSKNPISVTIRNHTDINSQHGFRAREYLTGQKGFIKLENCTWENGNNPPFFLQRWAADGVRIEVIDPTVIWNGTTSTGFSGYEITQSNGDLATLVLGNVHFYRPNIVVKEGATAPDRGIFLNSNTAQALSNISVIDPISLPCTISNCNLSILGNFDGVLQVSDRYGILKQSVSSNKTLTSGRYKRTYDNKGATGDINIELSPDLGLEITVNVVEPLKITLTPPTGKNISPVNSVAGQINATQKGSSITLVCDENGDFYATNVVGNWVAS